MAVLRVDHRRNLPDGAVEHAVGADGRNACGHAFGDEREVIFAQLCLQFHLTVLGQAEQDAAAGRDGLAGLHIAFQNIARDRRTNIEPCIACAGFTQLRIGNIDAGAGGITSRCFAIHIRLRNKAALNQLKCAV